MILKNVRRVVSLPALTKTNMADFCADALQYDDFDD